MSTTMAGATAKRLILIPSSKGGIGKTTIARLIGEAHREQGTHAVIVDADSAVGQLAKHLGARNGHAGLLDPQPVDGGVIMLDWHADVRGRDQIAAVLAYGMPSIIVDMPGGSLGTLLELDAEADLIATIAAAGYQVTVVVLITPYRETWADAARIRAWVPGADLVAVVNEGFGDADDFSDWRASETRAKLLASPRTKEVIIPRLESRIAASIAGHRLAFRAAAESEHLAVLDRGRARRWLTRCDDALAPVSAELGLAVR